MVEKISLKVNVPIETKEEIRAYILKGEYDNYADFIRVAIRAFLDSKRDPKENGLDDRRLRRFIEEIS